MVLLGENLGRHHERDAESALDRHQRTARGDDGLSRTDVTLHEPAHRKRAAHVATQFAENFCLRLGQLEAELAQEGFDESIIARAWKTRCQGLKIFAPALNCNLELNKLIERESLPGDIHIRKLLWKVEHMDGVRPRREIRQDNAGMRFGNMFLETRQRPPDQPAHETLRQALGERIDRRDAIDVDQKLLAAIDDFRLGMVDGARLEGLHLAEDHDFIAHREVVLHVGEIPPAAMQAARAVFEHEFKDRLGALGESLHPLRDDATARSAGSTELQLADGEQVTPILVTIRPVQQQVANGEELQAGKLRGAFRADAIQLRQRSGKRRHGRLRHGAVYRGSRCTREAGRNRNRILHHANWAKGDQFQERSSGASAMIRYFQPFSARMSFQRSSGLG